MSVDFGSAAEGMAIGDEEGRVGLEGLNKKKHKTNKIIIRIFKCSKEHLNKSIAVCALF